MSDWMRSLSDEIRQTIERSKQPQWTRPMLATLTHSHFSDPGWIYERKLDGERCLTFREGTRIQLMSRNKKELTKTYPEIAAALEEQSTQQQFVVDGEIVAFEGNVTSFSRLQHRMQVVDEQKARKSKIAVYYYLFDILHLEGCDLTQVPLRERKKILRQVFHFDHRIRFTPHRNQKGKAYLEQACRKGWEGLVAKEASSTYLHSRSKKWLKFKCGHRQEFVICGFTDPKGERVGFGALLMGYYQEDRLRYAGKVGTGYDDQMLETLGKRLASMERKDGPFEKGDVRVKNAHWVKPELVAEVRFTEWTDDGKLRHPVFLGLRRDKSPKRVTREQGSSG